MLKQFNYTGDREIYKHIYIWIKVLKYIKISLAFWVIVESRILKLI